MGVLTEVNSWMSGLLVVRGGGDSGRLASAAAPHFRFGRVMMPAHNSLQGDAFICVAAGRSLRRCQRQQPLTESVNIQLMISPLGRQEMVELEDATILESPQDADSNPNELCGISLPVDLSRTSARD